MTIRNHQHTRVGRRKIHDPAGVLYYIILYKSEHDGNSPTVRQIAEACDISSISVVNYLLRRLEASGHIRLGDDGKSRQIEVVGGRWRLGANVAPVLPSRRKYRLKQDPRLASSILGYLMNRLTPSTCEEIAQAIGAPVDSVRDTLESEKAFSKDQAGHWAAWEQ